MPVSMLLKKEFEYYRRNHQELVEEYDGKVIVIKDQRVIGVFSSEMEAIDEVSKTEPRGTFLVQECRPEIEVQSFASRVMTQG